MKRLVIADDFSGAAEIAGLAHRSGRSVTILTSMPSDGEIPETEVVVIDTDSRLLETDQARERLEAMGRIFATWKPGRIFKKIDSVLRGPVLVEIEALLDAGLAGKAVVASANPSRGRTIENGRYFLDGVLLHETEFAHDAFHPAKFSKVADIVGESARVEFPNVECENDLKRIASSIGEGSIPVGGADFYRACETIDPERGNSLSVPRERQRLWICGSLANRAGRESLYRDVQTEVVCCEPGSPEERWIGAAKDALHRGKDCALTLPDTNYRDPEQLLSFFAGIGAGVIASGLPDTVMVEGGATARSAVDRLGLSRFAVVGEVAQGIVAVRPNEDSYRRTFVVKPGSYPWPAGLIA